MGALKVTSVDLNAARACLNSRETRFAMDAIAKVLADDLRALLPVSNNNHPHARDNTYGTTRRINGVESGVVIINVSHALYILGPTRPHRIPLTGDGDHLRFYWEKAGRMWIPRWRMPDGSIKNWVSHPGSPGLDYFEMVCRQSGIPYRRIR